MSAKNTADTGPSRSEPPGFETDSDEDKCAKAATQRLSVGEIAKRSGIPVSTLHFYESKGLINSERNAGNQRRYPRYILRQLAVIRVAQSVGLSLAEIRSHLDALPGDGAPTAEDWQTLSSAWRADLEERIAKMTTLKDKLTACIGCGCLSAKDCPMRNPDDHAAALGPGARAFDPQ